MTKHDHDQASNVTLHNQYLTSETPSASVLTFAVGLDADGYK